MVSHGQAWHGDARPAGRGGKGEGMSIPPDDAVRRSVGVGGAVIRPAIRNEADYEAALRRIDALMDAAPDTPEGEELDVLTDLVIQYEGRMEWP